jgi:hypothetical protein
MVFKRKFFLDLSGDDAKKPVEVAPVKPVPEKSAQGLADGAGKGKAAVVAPEPAATATAPAAAPSGAGPVLTTAEAIAAELAAAQANRPAPSTATFAPDCLAPSGVLPRRRRLAGANLGMFKEMAKGMMRS